MPGLADLAKIAARSRVYISADAIDLTRLPAKGDPSDFTGVNWIEVEAPESLGELSDRAEMSEQGRSTGGPDLRFYYRRSLAAQPWEPKFTAKHWLPGQAALWEAHAAGVPVGIKIHLGAPVTGVGRQARLFAGVIGSIRETLGGSNDLPTITATVYRCSPVIRYVSTLED